VRYIFFLLKLIIIVIQKIIIKNCPTHEYNPTQPDLCGLGCTPVMGWVGFFFNPP